MSAPAERTRTHFDAALAIYDRLGRVAIERHQAPWSGQPVGSGRPPGPRLNGQTPPDEAAGRALVAARTELMVGLS